MAKVTRTFLLTDVEKSTRLSEQHGAAIDSARKRHVQLIRDAVQANGGKLYKVVGDGTQSAFDTATAALCAAVNAQLEHQKEISGLAGDLRSRMALHTLQAEQDEATGDYEGVAFNRAARLLSAGHGGQILVSLAAAEQLRYHLADGVTLNDMGEHRLKDLTEPEHIFQVAHPDLRQEFPELVTLKEWPNNLPVQATPLVGRAKEVAAVRSRLLGEAGGVRLLTLTGVGGIGKTRLALQAAAEMLNDFSAGVFFVNLAPIVDPALVVPTIAYTLGLREAGGQPIADTLKDYLKDKKLLLLLDNFEQVIEAAPSVSSLLAQSPGLKMLVTSRQALRLRGEQEHAVLPLDVPDVKKLPPVEELAQTEAVRLFIERAQAVKPQFELTQENSQPVAQICVRLDGIPLAIELAAARIKVLSPQAILSRLESRLKLLTGGARDLPERQQTLRAAIDWSYDLLEEGEKQLFRMVSVFRGGRTLEAIEAVCRVEGDLEVDVLDGVASLVDKSLMYHREGDHEGGREGAEGEPRYWMLETIQEYALEKLQECGEAEQLQREHALYFMRLAEEAESQLKGAKQQEWMDRLEEEHDNIRAALRRARERGERREREEGDPEAVDVEVGLRIAGAIWRFWYVRGYISEGRQWLSGLAELLGKGSAHAQSDQLGYRAKALNGAGVLTGLQGDSTAARALYEESLALSRELGDKWGIAELLGNLGVAAELQGDYTAARALYEESLPLSRELGDKWGIANSLANLGNVAELQGDSTAARALYEESLALSRELGDKRGIAYSLGSLGVVAELQGDYTAARALYEEGLALMRELGDKRGIAVSLGNLGNVAELQGDYTTARALYEESLPLRRELGDKRGIAVSLGNLGNVAHYQGDYTTARALYEESLPLMREHGDKRGTAISLARIGGVAVSIGKVQYGTRLLGLVEVLLENISAALDPVDRVPYERAVTSAREQLGEEEFKRAWEEGRAMSMEQAIEYALEPSYRV